MITNTTTYDNLQTERKDLRSSREFNIINVVDHLGNHHKLNLYLHENGHAFAIDCSFTEILSAETIHSDIVIPDPYAYLPKMPDKHKLLLQQVVTEQEKLMPVTPTNENAMVSYGPNRYLAISRTIEHKNGNVIHRSVSRLDDDTYRIYPDITSNPNIPFLKMIDYCCNLARRIDNHEISHGCLVAAECDEFAENLEALLAQLIWSN